MRSYIKGNVTPSQYHRVQECKHVISEGLAIRPLWNYLLCNLLIVFSCGVYYVK
jgi:hypothetical protein